MKIGSFLKVHSVFGVEKPSVFVEPGEMSNFKSFFDATCGILMTETDTKSWNQMPDWIPSLVNY